MDTDNLTEANQGSLNTVVLSNEVRDHGTEVVVIPTRPKVEGEMDS